MGKEILQPRKWQLFIISLNVFQMKTHLTDHIFRISSRKDKARYLYFDAVRMFAQIYQTESTMALSWQNKQTDANKQYEKSSEICE